MKSFSQVRSWSPSGAADAADQLIACGKKLSDILNDFQADGMPQGWAGKAKEAASVAHRDLCSSLESYLEQVQKAARAVTAAEGSIAATSEDARALMTEASHKHFTIDDSGAVHDVHPTLEFTSPAEAIQFAFDRKVTQLHLSAEAERILAQATLIDTALASSIKQLADQTDVQFDSGDTQGTLPPEVVAAWASMSDEERRAALQKLADEYADRYGIPHTTIKFENLPDADDGLPANSPDSRVLKYGYWSESTRTLVIDSSDLPNATAAFNTTAHEMRHAGQHEMARDANPNFFEKLFIDWGWETDPFQHPGVTKEQAKTWGENFDHYASPPTDPNDKAGWDAGWEAYLNQPVEVDARTIGEQEVDNMTLEHLNQLRK